MDALNYNIKLGESHLEIQERRGPSFFHSVAGLYTLGALYYNEVKNKEELKVMVDKLIDMFSEFENELGSFLEDDLVDGISGYLYCLLIIANSIDKNNSRIKERVRRLVEVII